MAGTVMGSVGRVVSDSMIGLKLPDYTRHSNLVITVLGQNPSSFTGPGTNTYIIGSGPRRLMLDTGQGVEAYAGLLETALHELAGGASINDIILTHAHIDHISGVGQVRARFGDLKVRKMPWPESDRAAGVTVTPIGDGAVIGANGVTLRAIHTPGHSPDHLCYYLEAERALFSGDVVLGAGTTVIPDDYGDLAQYMDSLRKLLAMDIEVIYPGHGPAIRNPHQKIRQYIEHRMLRESQIVHALKDGPRTVMELVRGMYADVPEHLHQAAASSVRSHLKKLERERVVTKQADDGRWILR
jgi:glyoxylase-like metal-dependent hydrolase (beta-lactamase superfamily II)